MRPTSLVFIGVFLFLSTIPSGHADPFKPRMSEPESYKDILYGLQELQENIDSVQCGGWIPGEEAALPVSPSAQQCHANFECRDGLFACGGTVGRAYAPRLPDNGVNICISHVPEHPFASEYMFVHELVHAKQLCAMGTFPQGRDGCCSIEREASRASCQMMMDDGLFAAPIDGITVTMQDCVDFGADNTCELTYGPSPCSQRAFPAGYLNVYKSMLMRNTGVSCEQYVENPTPRIQRALDELAAMRPPNPPAGAAPPQCNPDDASCVPLPAISPDLPGRRNVRPLGKAETGLGERGNFEYPESAIGFSSSCNIREQQIQDPDLATLGLNILMREDGSVTTEAGNGTIHINPYNWCRLDGNTTATPKYCEKLFRALQAMRNLPGIRPEPACICPPGAEDCPPIIEKRYCFDEPYTFQCHGTADLKRKVVTKETDAPPQEETCRTPWSPTFQNQPTVCHGEPIVGINGEVLLDGAGNPRTRMIVDVEGTHEATASSFYRHYGLGHVHNDGREPVLLSELIKNPENSSLSVTTPNGDIWKLRAECYEYYQNPLIEQEDDLKTRVARKEDEQCEIVILTEREEDPKLPGWSDGVQGSQKGTVRLPESVVREAPRDARVIPDPWLADAETNLSIIDTKKLKDAQKTSEDPADITGILSTVLTVKQRASRTVEKDGHVDGFSDDDHRALPIFWEAQQKELLKMTVDPVTKLLMPARALTGLAPDDPIYQYIQGTISRSDGTIEATLRSGDSDLENVLLSLSRMSIGPIQQVRIPVLMPLVTEQEITQSIFLWQQWKAEEAIVAPEQRRSSEAPAVDALIAQLEQYRTRVRDIPKLHTALATYLQKLYEPQQEIRSAMASWYEANARELSTAATVSAQRRELKKLWRETQNILLSTDQSQLLWCSNQRFSTPIPTLLDLPSPWWGDRAPGEERNQAFVPPKDEDLREIGYLQPKDREFDFSGMTFTREPIFVPTLWPVPVQVKLPVPPLHGSTVPSIAELPSLPPLPDATVFDDLPLPTVFVPDPTTVGPQSTPTDLAPAIAALTKFKTRMQMMKEAYERFQKSFSDLPDPEQDTANLTKIIHPESELLQRTERAFARWLPNRIVDADGRTKRLRDERFRDGEDTCREDLICLFLPPEEKTIASFQWSVPRSTSDAITALRDELRSSFLPTEESRNPFAERLPILERLFPSLPLPITFDLVPR